MAVVETMSVATRADQRLADAGAAAGALPAISADLMVQALDAYRTLQGKLDKAMPDQIMNLEGKPFRKKGYWRAVALAFNLTVDPVSEERTGTERFLDGRLNFGYVVTYRATHPSGRSQTGDGACFAIEKARRWKCPHPQPGNDRRTVHFPHNTCPDFDPDFSWRSLPAEATEHNVRSHAHTRAYNRAVSNLVGFGEVSAEEVDPSEGAHEQAQTNQKQAGAGATEAAKASGSQGPTGQPAAATAPGTTTVKKVTCKAGENAKGKYNNYRATFADGRQGSTFSDTVGKELQALEKSGGPVNPELQQDGKYWNIVALLPIMAAKPEPAPEPQHPDEPVDGPEEVLTIREVKTDQGPRWIIQTKKRQLITDSRDLSEAATKARANKVGVVPSFEVIQTSKGSANKLTALLVEQPDRDQSEREPGSDDA